MKHSLTRAALCCLLASALLASAFAVSHVPRNRTIATAAITARRIARQSPASPTTISAANTNGLSGTPSQNSYVYVDVPNAGSSVVSISIPSGSWSGTLQAQMSLGSSTRIVIPNWRVVNSGTGFPTGITSAAIGQWSLNVQGPGRFMLVASAWSSGSITPVLKEGPGTTAPASWSPYFANAVTSLTLVSSRPCQIGGLSLINSDSAAVYLVCFDATSTGAVTLGTTAPAFVVPYPQSNGTAANGTADRLGLPAGVTFQNGLVIAAVTLPGGSTLSTNGLTGSILWH